MNIAGLRSVDYSSLSSEILHLVAITWQGHTEELFCGLFEVNITVTKVMWLPISMLITATFYLTHVV